MILREFQGANTSSNLERDLNAENLAGTDRFYGLVNVGAKLLYKQSILFSRLTTHAIATACSKRSTFVNRFANRSSNISSIRGN